MIRFLMLVLKNLGRNPTRTLLTGLAIALLVAIFAFVTAVTGVINQVTESHSSETRLIVRERWLVPSRFPIRYVDTITEMPGVEDWTPWHFYGGFLDRNGNRAAGIATRIDNIKEMHTGLESLSEDDLQRMLETKDGALVGRQLADLMNWKEGDRFTVTSLTHPGMNVEFQVVAMIDSEVWGRNYFFHQAYYQDAVGDRQQVNLMWLKVTDVGAGRRVASAIEKQFENRQEQLMVETESSGLARFIGRTSAIVRLINFVVAILLVNMTIVLSNSISMTVRERRSEMAILKILGFSPGFVMALVVGEAVCIGMFSGALGAALAVAVSWANEARQLPFYISFLTRFPVTPDLILQGAGLGVLVALVGSCGPAWKAQKIKIDEAFAKIG